MSYLYHLVPEVMHGHVLYPLNQLKKKLPKVYEKEIKKYKSREFLLQRRIETLKCLWNDVLHLAAVHPQKIINALKEAKCEEIRNMRFYKINPCLLGSKRTTIYLYEGPQKRRDLTKEDCALYEPQRIAQYSKLEREVKEYYKDECAKGNRPLLFHMIPHILYKGAINIKNIPIIRVK